MNAAFIQGLIHSNRRLENTAECLRKSINKDLQIISSLSLKPFFSLSMKLLVNLHVNIGDMPTIADSVTVVDYAVLPLTRCNGRRASSITVASIIIKHRHNRSIHLMLP